MDNSATNKQQSRAQLLHFAGPDAQLLHFAGPDAQLLHFAGPDVQDSFRTVDYTLGRYVITTKQQPR